MREHARPRRSGRQVEGQIGTLRDTDVRADQVVDRGPDLDRFTGADRPGVDRQDHRILVAHGFEAQHGKTRRQRPQQFRFRQIGGFRPIDRRRITGVARRTPVDFPAIVQPELKTQRDGGAVTDGVGGGDQSHGSLLGFDPLGRRFLGSGGRRDRPKQRRQAEPGNTPPRWETGSRRSHRQFRLVRQLNSITASPVPPPDGPGHHHIARTDYTPCRRPHSAKNVSITEY